MDNVIKEYSNGEITIVWKPDLCSNSTICWGGLIEVFNPTEKPWVNPHGATTERIVEQIGKCPSKALTYYRCQE